MSQIAAKLSDIVASFDCHDGYAENRAKVTSYKNM